MLESAATELAYKSMQCPITGLPFKMEDIIPLVKASSGFAASGKVEAIKYRPGIN